MQELLDEARAVKAKYEAHWRELPGVSSIGIGQDESGHPVIVIRILEESPALKQIPEQINGVPVLLEKGSPVVAQ